MFSTIEKTLSFVYRIILSRTIGAEGMGIYQICLSVFAVFLTAASSGIPVTVSRMIAKQSATGSEMGKHAVVSAGVVCTLAFTVPAAIIIFFGRNLLSFLFPDESSLDIFILLLPGLILTSVYAVMRGTFWGNKQFLPYSIIELAEDSVMVILGSVLIFFASTPTEGAYFATIAVLVSYIFSFIVSVGWYLHKGGKFVNPKKYVRPLLGSAMPITAMRTSTSLLNSVVATFLPALLISACGMTNSEALAVYGAVTGMSLPVLFTPGSLIGSISVVAAPEMSENFYAGRTEKLRSDIEKTLKSSVLIAAVLIPLLFTLGDDIGVLLYDNAFSGAVITSFSFMLLPMSVSMMTTTVLNSMNCEVKTLIYFFAGRARHARVHFRTHSGNRHIFLHGGTDGELSDYFRTQFKTARQNVPWRAVEEVRAAVRMRGCGGKPVRKVAFGHDFVNPSACGKSVRVRRGGSRVYCRCIFCAGTVARG